MSCISDQEDLRVAIELLKQQLNEKEAQLVTITTACLEESDRQEELKMQLTEKEDKLNRLYDSHKRVQKINQNLEDKLLKLVDRDSAEKCQLKSDVATLSVRLAQANYNIANLQREIERYKADMGLAIQLLQCKPEKFVPQKITSLPLEMQAKVKSSYMRLETNSHSSHSDSEGVGTVTSGNYRVLPSDETQLPPTVCPFPPTAMTLAMRGLDSAPEPTLNGQLNVSPSVVAKFLEDELKASETKHCDTCKCPTKDLTVLVDIQKSYSIGTQTTIQGEVNALCLRCNSNLNSPSRTNSPYILNLVKSSDSLISEPKSSLSSNNQKNFTPVKKDDLTVNPILGHHRLCDRTSLLSQGSPMSLVNSVAKTPPSVNKTPPAPLKNISIDLSNQTPKSNIVSSPDNSTKSLKSEEKLQICNISENDGSHSKLISSHRNSITSNADNLAHGAGNGSTNSLMSRNSSKEGAKLFESFNRNLIKTIKAENPKMSGPRICALRIQNGSNNILLDNAAGHVHQVMYTRRPRLVDEELEDEKDEVVEPNIDNVVSSPISMVMSNSISYTNNLKKNSEWKGDDPAQQNIQKDISTPTKPLTNGLPENNLPSPGLEPTKSTQSSSLSSDIDLQETALLRRQQLTRVAEWVQNNSKISVNPSSTTSPISGGKVESTTIDIEDLENIAQTPMNPINTVNCPISPINNNHIQSTYLSSTMQMTTNSTNIQIPLRETHLNSTIELSSTIALNPEMSSSTNNLDSENNFLDNSDSMQQMEYNVKKFLLGTCLDSNRLPSSIFSTANSVASSDNQINNNNVTTVQRTETNL